MGLFNINYDTLVPQLLPVRLRQPVTTAWLKSLVSPVKWLYNLFTTNSGNNLYLLAHDGQVCYMEAVLNDVFDPVGRGIFISDGPFEDPLFTYLVPEVRPLWLGLVSEIGATTFPDPEVLYTDLETYALGVCFIVNVPTVVAAGPDYDINRLKALVDLYRLPGRTNYNVVTY